MMTALPKLSTATWASRHAAAEQARSPVKALSSEYTIHPVWAALGLSTYVLLCANMGLIKAIFNSGGEQIAQRLIFFLAIAVAVVLFQAALWLLIVPLRWARWVALVWITVSVATGYLQQSTGAVIDPSMLRNALHTNWPEAKELMTLDLLLRCAIYTGPAWLATRHVRVQHFAKSWGRASLVRLGAVILGIQISILVLLCVMQPLASWMRNDKAARYLITPSNVIWSASVALFQDARVASSAREPVGTDAQAGASWATRKKPMVVIVVVGETARAANWGLNKAIYPNSRNTTPELGQLNIVNMPRVEACGTNTEVSVPCMFSLLGRHRYDQALISSQESVLHVLARAGVRVHWRDNQSGCKGVCADLPQQMVDAQLVSALCASGRCL